MESDLVTAPELADVLDELRRREPIFHRPEFGSTRADFERMTADDFWEIGASGQLYSREHVLDVLKHPPVRPNMAGSLATSTAANSGRIPTCSPAHWSRANG